MRIVCRAYFPTVMSTSLSSTLCATATACSTPASSAALRQTTSRATPLPPENTKIRNILATQRDHNSAAMRKRESMSWETLRPPPTHTRKVTAYTTARPPRGRAHHAPHAGTLCARAGGRAHTAHPPHTRHTHASQAAAAAGTAAHTHPRVRAHVRASAPRPLARAKPGGLPKRARRRRRGPRARAKAPRAAHDGRSRDAHVPAIPKCIFDAFAGPFYPGERQPGGLPRRCSERPSEWVRGPVAL